ncbi:HlyD family secretion protein [Catalinimonas alkaloidigena]|uniref:HlyD family secretion protein n=1 Tax=Catalinimonas alkaloidigena TaxID=1075417 RepID=A0A1G8X1J6_9BACT|nr:efflux RND transporter periplasmic adaptor subunit [Catalinimonas alkaloidigena]SDJ84331.1 HlyD family secretion protein [Catalinimonas alkaloidigena]
MNKKLIFIALAVVIAAAAAYFAFFRDEAPSLQVEMAVVRTGDLYNAVTATGTIQPLTQVEVGTQVSGTIEKIYVDFNTEVKKGDLMAELDRTALHASLAEMQASLSSAQNELDYQQKNYNRMAQLHQAKTVSDTDYEQALYQLNSAKATVAQRTSELNRAKTNLNYASIYSPIDGVVLSRSVDEGQTVAASYSTPTLFTIAQDLTKMQVEADVDEADIGQVKRGQRVSFTVDAFPDDAFEGEVTQVRLEPTEESNVVTYTVIIQAENPEGKLMPGMTASTTIYTKEAKNVLMLEAKALRFHPDPVLLQVYERQTQVSVTMPDRPPQDALSQEDAPPAMQPVANHQTTPADNTPDAASAEVWVKHGQTLQPVQVTTGLSDGTHVEIRSGLQAGDQVVASMTIQSAQPSPAAPGSSPFMPQPPGRR